MLSKKIVVPLCLCFLSFFFEATSVSAAYLYFSPATKTAANQESISVDILVNTEGEQISAADAYIEYNNSLLSVQSVQNKSYFPYQTHAITGNRIALRGLVFDAETYVTGTGTMATITFQVLAEGTGRLTFFCDKNVSSTSRIVKNDTTATNLIDCSRNGSMALTVAGPSATPTPTPTPSLTPTPTPCLPSTAGDADCNGVANLTDFEIWRKEFAGELTTMRADFNTNGAVTIADFEIWRKNFFP